MNKIWDAIVDGLLGIINFFEHIKSRPGDDEFTAEYKQHYRDCTASIVYLVIAFIIVLVASSEFESLTGLKTYGVMFEGMRKPIGIGLIVILAGSFLYALFSFISLFIFYRKHSRNN